MPMSKLNLQTGKFVFAHSPAEMVLESGKKLGPITIVYETYGQLNSHKNNAILVLHALSGNSHAAGKYKTSDKKSGWWDIMIGPGKPFDTDKYFVICSNVLGGCDGSTGPSSVNPDTGKPYGMNFPIITIADMVNAQKRLLDHLGISSLYSIAGGSMGGMQVLKWAQLYPEIVKSAIVIASTSKLTPQSIAFNEVGRQAIISDQNWNKGEYYDQSVKPDKGLSVARMLGHITYLSDKSMRTKFGRQLKDAEKYKYDFLTEFQVESYLHYQGQTFTERFDANTYIYLTKAIDYFDLGAGYGSLSKALKNVSSKFLILSYSTDWLFPSEQSLEIVQALRVNNVDVTFCEIKSDYGHDAFLIKNATYDKLVNGFLDNVAEL